MARSGPLYGWCVFLSLEKLHRHLPYFASSQRTLRAAHYKVCVIVVAYSIY
jgi:hypothetical protein